MSERGCDTWRAEREREYCEKLAKTADSTMRAGWISQVVKGDACEKRPNHTDSWGGTPRTCWEIGPRWAGTHAGNK